MSKQPHAALLLPVRGAEATPIGSGTLKETENDLLGHILGSSISTSPSSARSTKLTILGSPVAKTVDFDLAKPQVNILNQSESSGRSVDGGVGSADIDQPGSAVDSTRVQANRRPGESELLPGVQAPRA